MMKSAARITRPFLIFAHNLHQAISTANSHSIVTDVIIDVDLLADMIAGPTGDRGIAVE